MSQVAIVAHSATPLPLLRVARYNCAPGTRLRGTRSGVLTVGGRAASHYFTYGAAGLGGVAFLQC